MRNINKSMKEKIEEIYNLQNELNINTIKLTDWVNGIAPNGMVIDWLRYAKLETSELVESFPVKHWKDINKPIDLLNAKIEQTDIFHFLMSQLIVQDVLGKTSKEKSIDFLSNLFAKNMDEKFFSVLNQDKLSITKSFFKNIKQWELLLAIEHLKDNQADMEVLFLHFCLLCNNLELTFEELYKLYIGKNCLNQFRQDNGYKEGTYLKIWNGKEDNVVMKEILDNGDYSFEELYLELRRYYSN